MLRGRGLNRWVHGGMEVTIILLSVYMAFLSHGAERKGNVVFFWLKDGRVG